MLDVCELDFDYQDQPILHNVSIHLSAGGLLHLRGANGAGKTTLLKIIAGLLHPTAGSIHFAGHSIHDDLGVYQSQIAYVGHKSGISPYLTIRENCAFDLHYHHENIHDLAAIFKLQDSLDHVCGLLSAGQRRQVALLRLWMTKARLWLLDEPLVALDDTALALVMAKIDKHRAEGGAVLLTSHQNLPAPHATYQEHLL